MHSSLVQCQEITGRALKAHRSRDRPKLRKNAPASGRWQAKACPTIAGTRLAVVGHALACLAPIFSHLLTVAAPMLQSAPSSDVRRAAYPKTVHHVRFVFTRPFCFQ